MYRYKMRLYILLVTFFASVLAEVNDLNSRLVQIKSGFIRGYKDPEEDVFIFRGVPYAKAPSGTQRFKAPLPPPVWPDILEAIDNGIICPQMRVTEFVPESKEIREDCLIANIYVPATEGHNLPVVVYIHGGGFIFGFGDLATPKKIVSSKNIIAITFNYRLGAHGFLCLGTADIPGNAGMKDQVAMLRWVKENIASFGGNPNDVTISGYSAGSSSVNLLMISKTAEGLFTKVIPESGASLSPYGIQTDPIQNAKEYAKLIEIYSEDDIYKLENDFKEISYEVLQSGNIHERKDATFLFAPCVERDRGQEIFLKDNPVNLLRQGNYPKLPMLYGFAHMEGLMRMPSFDLWKKEMNKNFALFLPADLHFKNQEEKKTTVNAIREFYFGNKPVDDNTVLEYIDYMSDVLFTCPTLREVNYLLEAGHNEIFLYEYSFTDENTPFVPYTDVRGAEHCAQTIAVLDGFNTSLSTDYLKMKSLMRELWANFITNGNPTASGVPVWKPVGKDWSPHMALKKNPELRGSLLRKRCLFWDKIYDLYYKFPVLPQVLSPKPRNLIMNKI